MLIAGKAAFATDDVLLYGFIALTESLRTLGVDEF